MEPGRVAAESRGGPPLVRYFHYVNETRDYRNN